MSQHYTAARHFTVENWRVGEERFSVADYRLAESVLALANGYMGQRASFEEGCAGVETLRGNYVAGVFDSYPNATMIRLKGRPTHPNKMVNIPDHLPLSVRVDGQVVDLGACRVESFRRTLHMDRGVLEREFVCELMPGRRCRIAFQRFLSQTRRHVAATRVRVTPLGFSARVSFSCWIEGNVTNVGTSHLEDFDCIPAGDDGVFALSCRTKTTAIRIALAGTARLWADAAEAVSLTDEGRRIAGVSRAAAVEANRTVTFDRFVAVATSRDLDSSDDPLALCRTEAARAAADGFEALVSEQEAAWARLWSTVDIDIRERSGDGALAQGLRYSVFQMLQNAPCDETVNIGAKGLSGEHYFGTYFWDTEVYMLPMFALIRPEAARDLVRFRIRTLPAARAKAAELDCKGAVYPWMADADGNEACTLWQFSLLAVHVTADVAWGVWYYYCATGDLDLIADGGIDVMVETSRFWLSRVFWSEPLGRYVINRVLGPDEYHQGVDNNYYTNLMAREGLLKTCRLAGILKQNRPEAWAAARDRLDLADEELAEFERVARLVFLPRDETLGISLQDDSFLRLEPCDRSRIPAGQSLNQAWSYDRLMRTQLLRQADVVVAHLLVGDAFTPEQIRRDFAYYEPRTTHDSSLSFCTHAVIAAQLGRTGMAYEYFLQTARLDLDDLHGNSWMGVHTACLAGAWQCVVFGFGGLRWYDGVLSLAPVLPAEWDEYSFSVWWHGTRLRVRVQAAEVELETEEGELSLTLYGRPVAAGPRPASFPRPA